MEIFNFKTEQHGNMLVLNFKGWDNYGVVLVIDLKSEKQILMDHGELSVVVCQDGGCLSIDGHYSTINGVFYPSKKKFSIDGFTIDQCSKNLGHNPDDLYYMIFDIGKDQLDIQITSQVMIIKVDEIEIKISQEGKIHISSINFK